MMRLLFGNLGWKIFSLALAFALWLAFVGRPELARSISVPIEYRNMPSGFEMSSNVPEQVRLDVRGSSARLDATDFSGAAVVLNLGSIHEAGERTFTIDESTARLPFGVRLMRAIPQQIRIRFELQVSRMIPVRVQFGKPPAGYRIQAARVYPEKLEVVGPQSSVNAIGYTETDPIDLSETVSRAEFRTHVFLSDRQVRFVSSPVVWVEVVLEKTNGPPGRRTTQ